MAPWYTHVEQFIGVSGNNDGLEEVPDGAFASLGDECYRKAYQKEIKRQYPNRTAVVGRCAHLTAPKEIHREQGVISVWPELVVSEDAPRRLFSSNASTLPWAKKTGNLQLKTHQIVSKILYDPKTEKATG